MKKPHVSQNGQLGFEWYTPHLYIAAARRVLGGIGLDPSSSRRANTVVKALHYLTIFDDALDPDTPWVCPGGTLWLNPPFEGSLIRRFATRLLHEMDRGGVKQAIWLSNNGTETKWAQKLLAAASAVCFPSTRIKFLSPRTLQPREGGGALQGQMIIGLNVDADLFTEAYNDLGVVRR